MFNQTCNEYQLRNGQFEYRGFYHGIRYCINTSSAKTEDEVLDFLDSKSTDTLLNMVGYVMEMK